MASNTTFELRVLTTASDTPILLARQLPLAWAMSFAAGLLLDQTCHAKEVDAEADSLALLSWHEEEQLLITIFTGSPMGLFQLCLFVHRLGINPEKAVSGEGISHAPVCPEWYPENRDPSLGDFALVPSAQLSLWS